jgi:hypothetical protein
MPKPYRFESAETLAPTVECRRQWLLSVPFELRLRLARDPRALTAVGRILAQEIFRWQRERAALSGLRSTASGAVCFPQRFGGSTSLNVHFHVAVPDGVFTAAEGAARADFWRLPIDVSFSRREPSKARPQSESGFR